MSANRGTTIVQPSSPSSSQTLYDLLDLEFPEPLKKETANARRVELRDRLFVNVLVRELTDEGLGPAREYPLRDLSTGGMSITSPELIETGSVFEVEGCINHRTWKGRLRVVHSTLADNQYKVGMQLIDQPDVPQPPRTPRIAALPTIELPGQPWTHAGADSGLAQMEIDLDRVRNAVIAAENTWEQLGKTARKLILKAVGNLPEAAKPEPPTETNHHEHPRQSTNLDAGMIIMGSQSWRRLAIHVTDVSEGGLGAKISNDQLDNETVSQNGGEYVLHVGLPVMMAFGAEPDTIWLPAEIVHFDEDRPDSVNIGVQFITPRALQFFGA